MLPSNQSPQLKGFFLERLLVPADHIVDGGPPRDGIPSIDFPQFLSASDTAFLRPESPVLGVFLNGIATAYPIAILNHHEIVNDNFANQPVVISYSPLCGCAMAFKAGTPEAPQIFGTSGLLYQNNLLLYDRETESLWSQIMGKAISGSLAGSRLTGIPAFQTSWKNWTVRFPDSLVLSTETGFDRDYLRSPYQGYEKSADLFFPVTAESSRLASKEKVLGIEIDGWYKAYPFSVLQKLPQPVRDRFNGREFLIHFDRESQSGWIESDGKMIPAMTLFWFTWFAFHPRTEVYSSTAKGNPD